MIKRTTKNRIKIFYNKLENKVYKQTKIGSFIYKSESNELIDFDVINNNKDIYLDISLFPAHIYKNYGTTAILSSNKLVWLFNYDSKINKYIKPRMIYLLNIHFIENTYDYIITYNKVNLDGNISNSINTIKLNYNELYKIKEVKENYQVQKTIKLY